MKVQIGCSGITWRKRGLGDGLDEIAATGYAGAPISGVGTIGADEIRDLYATHGLEPAPGYLQGDFWDPAQRDQLHEAARLQAQVHQALGVSDIFIAVGGFEVVTRAGRTRRQAAAHVGPLDRLTDEEFRQTKRTIAEVCEIFLEHGVHAGFHTHVGTFVETEDEIESLLAAIDPELLFVGPDTGHLAWAGIDVEKFVLRHIDRVRSVHVKDIDLAVRDQGRSAGWTYAQFEEAALWKELGEGDLDFPAVFKILADADYTGWITVETDITQQPTPADSARISRAYLNELGL
ncbi:TIM barrel protein [Aeromicrobium sp. CFBP 8757]|uniref:sugar phosphate isomerase/epimerase family protein n=1 Tax=Aeromicrobium sp. CFBP 8757 TaxID=2775288 RepID=UPI001784380B|nr:sugar phosphate isomerase/epimerase [Aeromicrobium sp. CFBP 8757]MBD8605402.1 TIM barrel protein [Aeromicrobium sp. CFBP 8757]